MDYSERGSHAEGQLPHSPYSSIETVIFNSGKEFDTGEVKNTENGHER